MSALCVIDGVPATMGNLCSSCATSLHTTVLSVPRLLRANYHFCVVPGAMKAEAVTHMLRDEISVRCPASALRTCENAVLYLDADSGARW